MKRINGLSAVRWINSHLTFKSKLLIWMVFFVVPFFSAAEASVGQRAAGVLYLNRLVNSVILLNADASAPISTLTNTCVKIDLTHYIMLMTNSFDVVGSPVGVDDTIVNKEIEEVKEFPIMLTVIIIIGLILFVILMAIKRINNHTE